MWKLKTRSSLLLAAVLVFSLFGSAQTSSDPVSAATRDSAEFLQRATQHPRLADHEAEIDRLLSRMTLQEKVGQMTQLEIGMVSDGIDQGLRINPAKLE